MKKQAFTLLELIISFGIITASILLVAAIFSSLLRGSQKNADLSAGVLVARSVLADYCYGVLNNDTDRNAFFGGGYTPDPMFGVQTLYNMDFQWRINTQSVPALEDTSFPAVDDSRVRLVQIEVYWAGGDGVTRQGSGLLRTQLTRLLNEQMRQ